MVKRGRWNRIKKPVPVSAEYHCKVGDVVSQYGGFNTSLVLEIDDNGIPTKRLPMKGQEIVLDEQVKQMDDGRLWHTDRVSTEEEWRSLAGYAHWKTNKAMRERLWQNSDMIYLSGK